MIKLVKYLTNTHMAKRRGALGSKRPGTRTHKTKKRREIKRLMLEARKNANKRKSPGKFINSSHG